jgi:hypothetical protein
VKVVVAEEENVPEALDVTHCSPVAPLIGFVTDHEEPASAHIWFVEGLSESV